MCSRQTATLGIIIPARDEASRISRLLDRLHRVLIEEVRLPHRLVVVDDGSRDGTLERVTQFASDFPCVVPIRLPYNKGKGGALSEGIRHSQTELLLFIDGDGQHNPEDVPRMLEPLLRGDADVVLGSRLMDGCPSSMPLRHYLAILIASRLFNMKMKTSFRDILCGFRAFRSATSKPAIPTVDGYGIEVSALRECVSTNLTVIEVPCASIYEGSASIAHGLRVMGEVLLEVIRT